MFVADKIRTDKKAAWILLLILMSAGTSLAEASENMKDPGFPVYLHTDASFYIDNLEYTNKYQEGITFFGAQTSLYFTVDRPRFDFSLGVFLRREFGDEDDLSMALPLFRFRYKTDYGKFIFGFIDSSNNHGLPEAILSLQYPFVYPVEEGLQILPHYRNFNGDAWINWYLLNTPDHREFFAAGVRLSASWSFFSCMLAGRASHHGGQLYDVGPVTNNVAGVIRATLSETWDALRADFGIFGSFYGSYTDEDLVELQALPSKTGYGGGATVFFAPYGWRLYYEIFFGHNYYCEQGNALYRSNKPLSRFGVLKRFHLYDMIRGRFQVEGIVVDSRLEYNYMLVIDVFFDFFLHRFGGKPG